MKFKMKTKRMNDTSFSILATSVALVAVFINCGLTQAKSISTLQDEQINYDKDPMLALPSSTISRQSQDKQQQLNKQKQQSTVMIEQQQARPSVEIQYVYTNNGQPVAIHQEPQEDSISTAQLVKEYRQLSSLAGGSESHQLVPASADGGAPPYQLIQVSGAEPQAHFHDGINCNKKHEYTSIISLPNVGQQEQPTSATSSEYPGEIIYVDQNGEAHNAPQANTGSQGGESSGLAATILTEVPISEMPADVLDKLKREYGVRVVATRERPGANLVINCDEYTNQPGSICNRNQAQAGTSETLEKLAEHHPPAGTYIVYPQPQHSAAGEEHYGIPTRSVEHHHYEQPEQHHPTHDGAANVEDQSAYMHRSGVTSPAAESPEAREIEYVPTLEGINSESAVANPNSNSDSTMEEPYGTRSTSPMNNEQVESIASATPTNEQVKHNNAESSSAEQQQPATDGSVDSDAQDSHRGFDHDQAKGDAEPVKESSEQEYASRQ